MSYLYQVKWLFFSYNEFQKKKGKTLLQNFVLLYNTSVYLLNGRKVTILSYEVVENLNWNPTQLDVGDPTIGNMG